MIRINLAQNVKWHSRSITLPRTSRNRERLDEGEVFKRTYPALIHFQRNAMTPVWSFFGLIEARLKQGKYSTPYQMWEDVKIIRDLFSKLIVHACALDAFRSEGQGDLPLIFVKHALVSYNEMFSYHLLDRNVVFEVDHSKLDDKTHVVNITGRDFHAILTDILMGATIASQPKKGAYIKIVATTEINKGTTYIRITETDNGEPRAFILLPNTKKLLKKYNGFKYIEFKDGITTASVFLPLGVTNVTKI